MYEDSSTLMMNEQLKDARILAGQHVKKLGVSELFTRAEGLAPSRKQRLI